MIDFTQNYFNILCEYIYIYNYHFHTLMVVKQWLLNIDDSGIIHVYYSLSFLLYGLSNLGVTQ